jgi:hypothetical protein
MLCAFKMTTVLPATASSGVINGAVINQQLNAKGNPMRPAIYNQRSLLLRKSYKPNRVLRIRPAKLNFVFRPVRFGLKPQVKMVP